jgi:predicted AAA+ superfamily ATPase
MSGNTSQAAAQKPNAPSPTALVGGFPEPMLELSESTRSHWLISYIDQILTRDVTSKSLDRAFRDPEKLSRYFQAYALNSAGLVNEKTLYDTARINQKTASAYNEMLLNLMVIDEVPAWTSNRLKRLVLAPKRYLIDSALYAGYLGIDANGVISDGDVLGRLLDTFVAGQLRSQISSAAKPCKLHHLRQEQGRREIDLVIEVGASKIIGLEIKASSSPTSAAGQHLAWLRDELGDQFVAGIVLHTGPQTYSLGDRIVAAPICTLWSGTP